MQMLIRLNGTLKGRSERDETSWRDRYLGCKRSAGIGLLSAIVRRIDFWIKQQFCEYFARVAAVILGINWHFAGHCFLLNL